MAILQVSSDRQNKESMNACLLFRSPVYNLVTVNVIPSYHSCKVFIQVMRRMATSPRQPTTTSTENKQVTLNA